MSTLSSRPFSLALSLSLSPFSLAFLSLSVWLCLVALGALCGLLAGLGWAGLGCSGLGCGLQRAGAGLGLAAGFWLVGLFELLAWRPDGLAAAWPGLAVVGRRRAARRERRLFALRRPGAAGKTPRETLPPLGRKCHHVT